SVLLASPALATQCAVGKVTKIHVGYEGGDGMNNIRFWMRTTESNDYFNANTDIYQQLDYKNNANDQNGNLYYNMLMVSLLTGRVIETYDYRGRRCDDVSSLLIRE
ncbi:hypothetical protein, partial [Vibrio metoecus]|uniref:hypothetical protein n=1 Tax=Vibrio metoecus TaxID=1481663 RepID=UPI00215D4DFE